MRVCLGHWLKVLNAICYIDNENLDKTKSWKPCGLLVITTSPEIVAQILAAAAMRSDDFVEIRNHVGCCTFISGSFLPAHPHLQHNTKWRSHILAEFWPLVDQTLVSWI